MENLTKEMNESIEAEVSKIEFDSSNSTAKGVYHIAIGEEIFTRQKGIESQVTTLGALLYQISKQNKLKGKWVAYAANCAVYSYTSPSFKSYKGTTVVENGHSINAMFIAD